MDSVEVTVIFIYVGSETNELLITRNISEPEKPRKPCLLAKVIFWKQA